MESRSVIENRRSVRAFTDRSIPECKIREIIELGHMAPSAGNLQARDFILIGDEEKMKELAKNAFGQRPLIEADWVVAVCANEKRSGKKYGERGKELYSIQDATAAVENMLLAVTDKGFGSVWIGAFEEEKVSEQLGLPSHVRPVALLPIGHPAKSPDAPPKKYAKELTHEGGW